jgi:hypothetical protein
MPPNPTGTLVALSRTRNVQHRDCAGLCHDRPSRDKSNVRCEPSYAFCGRCQPRILASARAITRRTQFLGFLLIAVGTIIADCPRTDPDGRSLVHLVLISDEWRRSRKGMERSQVALSQSEVRLQPCSSAALGYHSRLRRS